MRTVYKSNGIVYVKDSSGTWVVTKGNNPNPYSLGQEFLFKRTWLSVLTMTKYGEFETYEEMIDRVRSII